MTDRNKNMTLYAIAIASILMQFAPVMPLQIFSMLLLLGLFATLPFYRRSVDPASGHYSHVTWVNRSLWIWSFILILGMIAAAVLIATTFQHSDFLNVMNDLASMNTNTPMVRKFIWISSSAVAPSFFYLGWRLFKGLRTALRGLPVDNPKSLL